MRVGPLQVRWKTQRNGKGATALDAVSYRACYAGDYFEANIFSTKNTHGKLEQGCAFPLQVLRDECSGKFATRLRQIANSVILDVESVRCYDVQNKQERKARSETTTALQQSVDAPYSFYCGWSATIFPSSTVDSDSDLFSKFARGINIDFEQDDVGELRHLHNSTPSSRGRRATIGKLSDMLHPRENI